MPMKWPAKVFIVIAILVGIYYGTDRKDHDRWLAALGLSGTSAAKLRMETQRDQYLAGKAAEEARWRGSAQTASNTGNPSASLTGAPLSRDEICAGVREREHLLKSQGKDLDAGLLKLKIFCAEEHTEAP